MRPQRQRSARGEGATLRAEILDAAQELLTRTGNADAVSIREVGAVVGVSAPSIYRHFTDKDELIEAVVARVFENLDVAMAGVDHPDRHAVTRLRDLGMAYVRFAREHPEQYRLATAATGDGPRAVDQVLTSGAFQRLSQIVLEAMEDDVIAPGDPLPVALQMWSTAHGIASLLIAKPYLPWGDPEAVADRVLTAACLGHALVDALGGVPGPDDLADRLIRLRSGAPVDPGELS